MDPQPAPTVCILRRMKRKPLSIWSRNALSPGRGLAREFEFYLLDKDETRIGTLAYSKVNFLKGSELSTPWGPAKLGFETWKGGLKLFLNERELTKMDSYVLRKTVELTFADGMKIVFVVRKRSKNDLEYFGENGYVGVFEEMGVLPDSAPIHEPQLSKEELKMLPKDQRPRSVVTREFRQFRMKAWGALPVRLEDLKAALMIFASFGCLVEENP